MKKNLFLIIMVLSLIAFINATYLTYRSYTIDMMGSSEAFCDLSETFSCSTVLANPYAKIGGLIPFPLVAMFVYPLLFLIARFGYKSSSRKNFQWLAVLSALGILFNGTFIYIETTIIKSFCPLCIICSGIILSIFICSLIGLKQK